MDLPLTKEACQHLAEAELQKLNKEWEKKEDRLVLLPEYTLEFEAGWVFPYTSERFHKTGDFQYAIAGNAPLLVDKWKKTVQATGTGESQEVYIEAYLVENYEKDLYWELNILPSQTLTQRKTLLIRTIKETFGYTSAQALFFFAHLSAVRWPEADKLPALQDKLKRQGITLEFERKLVRST